MHAHRPTAPLLVAAMTVAVTALALLWMGRDPVCTCGSVKLWYSGGGALESSKHLFDWYTPSHLLHGFLFYWPLSLLAPRLGFSWRLAIATAVEGAWEIVENTPMVIERYRAVTVSLDYNGDSVVNSMADIFAMALGFALARVIPVWASVAVVIGFETLTALVIRDGLALNVLMLIWPLDAVLHWQAGG